jgi:hypothetical protein
MATDTLATADALLKEDYLPGIRKQVNDKTYLLDQIERDSEQIDFKGRRAIFDVYATPNMSPTSFSDAGTLASPLQDVDVDGIALMRYHDGALELSDALIKQARDNSGAFASALVTKTERLAQWMRKNLNRQAFGDGTGLITTIGTGGAGTTTTTVASTQYLRVGQVVDVLNTSTGAATNGGSSVVISAINRSTKVVTYSAALAGTTPSDNTYGLYMPGARNNEIDGGLRAVNSTSRTLHSINSATAGNEWWNGNVVAAGSAVAGEDLFEQVADQVGQQGGTGPDVFLTTRGIRRRLANTYQSTKRFNDKNAVEIHGGYTAIMVNEYPVVADDDVPKGWAFAIAKDSFRWFQLGDPDWLDAPGGQNTIWHLSAGSVAGTHKAAWRAYFVWYANLACLAPNQNGAISGATDDSASGAQGN